MITNENRDEFFFDNCFVNSLVQKNKLRETYNYFSN